MDECVFQMWGKKEAGVIYMWFVHSLMSHSCSGTAADYILNYFTPGVLYIGKCM